MTVRFMRHLVCMHECRLPKPPDKDDLVTMPNGQMFKAGLTHWNLRSNFCEVTLLDV